MTSTIGLILACWVIAVPLWIIALDTLYWTFRDLREEREEIFVVWCPICSRQVSSKSHECPDCGCEMPFASE